MRTSQRTKQSEVEVIHFGVPLFQKLKYALLVGFTFLLFRFIFRITF